MAISLEELHNSYRQPTDQKDKSSARYEPVTEGSVGSRALQNAPASAVQFVKDVFEPIMNPIQTAKSLGELSKSVVSLMKDGEQGNEDIAREVGKFFANRYGSLDKIKETFANDPVGIMGDLSLALSGGGLVARGAAKGSQVANAVTAAAKYTDPIRAATYVPGKALNAVGRGVKQFSGVATGTGTAPLDAALRGGDTFTDAMRGKVSEQDIFNEAVSGVKTLKENRSSNFVSGKAKFAPQLKNTEVSNKVKDDIRSLVNNYKSRENIFPGNKTDTILNTIENTVLKQVENPIYANKMTAYDLDQIRELFNQIDIPTDAAAKARQAYSQIKTDFANIFYDLAPKGYREFLKGYGDATKNIEDLVKGLSVKEGATRQTSVNKLLRAFKNEGSIMNEILNELPNAKILSEQLAGYSVNKVLPPGLARSFTAALVAPAVATGVLPLTSIVGVAGVSPRIAGEITRAIGSANRFQKRTQPVRAGLLGVDRQVGRLQNEGLLQ